MEIAISQHRVGGGRRPRVLNIPLYFLTGEGSGGPDRGEATGEPAAGGPPTPGVGFALGQERLAMVLDAVGRKPPDPRLTVFFISADEAGALEGLKRAAELRRAGIACDLDPRGGKLQFKQAERVGARYALVLGGNEVQTGQAQLRDLATREETPVALAELAARVPR